MRSKSVSSRLLRPVNFADSESSNPHRSAAESIFTCVKSRRRIQVRNRSLSQKLLEAPPGRPALRGDRRSAPNTGRIFAPVPASSRDRSRLRQLNNFGDMRTSMTLAGYDDAQAAEIVLAVALNTRNKYVDEIPDGQ
jgi:hypothetical protein